MVRCVPLLQLVSHSPKIQDICVRVLNWFNYIMLSYRSAAGLSLFRFLKNYYLYSRISFKFTGKGYRVFWTERNSCAPSLGFSHFILKYHFNTLPVTLSKYSYYVLGLGLFQLSSLSSSVASLRGYNPYTSRGFRPFRDLIYLKVGKVGSYI